MESKSILELRKLVVNTQQNIQRLYSISSALFKEIQDVKRFVNFRHEDSLGDVESSTSNVQSKNSDNMVQEYADSLKEGRKLKIINN